MYIFLFNLGIIKNKGSKKTKSIANKKPFLVSILANGANNNAGKKIIYEGNFKLRMLIKF